MDILYKSYIYFLTWKLYTIVNEPFHFRVRTGSILFWRCVGILPEQLTHSVVLFYFFDSMWNVVDMKKPKVVNSANVFSSSAQSPMLHIIFSFKFD